MKEVKESLISNLILANHFCRGGYRHISGLKSDDMLNKIMWLMNYFYGWKKTSKVISYKVIKLDIATLPKGAEAFFFYCH